MKVLITGGAGFIGFHLANALIKSGYIVDLTDIIDPEKFDNDLNELIQKENCKYIKCNLLDLKQVELFENDYDFIIHLAAILGVER